MEVRLGGLGGQGLVTVGVVLADAAAGDGLQVAASQSYGSRARGGATRSDVILSIGPIDFPHVIAPHFLVALAQEAYDDYVKRLAPGAVVFYDAFFVQEVEIPDARQYAVEATKAALDRFGRGQAANFVMLGALVGFTDLISPASARSALEKNVKERYWEMNWEAFETGLDFGRGLGQWEGLPWG